MSVLSRFSCIKSAFLRSSRSRSRYSPTVNPGFAIFGARKIRSRGNSENFPVLKYKDGFTNFASYSDKRRGNSHSEDKSEKKPDWKWKTLSLAGAALFAIAQSRSTESNVFSNWSTVHAAEPVAVASDSNEFNSRSSEDASLDNSPHSKIKTRRQQLNLIAHVVESAARSAVCIQVNYHRFGGIVQSSGCGSGFIIRSDGLILTNARVVDKSGITSLIVRLHDGRIFVGELYAIDSKSDLALIRIREKNLPVLSFGCSSDIRIGKAVAAINYVPGVRELFLSLRHSVQCCILYQTHFDSAGGPLVNMDGDTVGLNSGIAKVAGIFFAIPSYYVKLFLAEVDLRKKAGTAMPFNIRRYTGLTMLPLTDENDVVDFEKSEVSHGVSQGVLVVNVVGGSEAFLAGIRPGDIIVKINGKSISSVKDVYDVLELEVPRAIPLEVILRREKSYRFWI